MQQKLEELLNRPLSSEGLSYRDLSRKVQAQLANNSKILKFQNLISNFTSNANFATDIFLHERMIFFETLREKG